MNKMSEDQVFKPIDNIFEEMMSRLERMDYDEDLTPTAIKVGLLTAYQAGQSSVIDRLNGSLLEELKSNL